MTCQLDQLSTDTIDELVTNVLHPEAVSRHNPSSTVPEVCDLEPPREGETPQQRRCRLIEGLIMLSRWFYCATQSDPEGCFDDECENYADRVDACYPT